MPRSKARRIVAAAAGCAALVSPNVARAHQVGMSRGDYEVAEHGLDARLSLSRADLAGAIADLDADHDGALTEAELDAKKVEVARLFTTGLVVRAGGKPCPVTLGRAALEAPDGVALELHAECPAMTGALALDLDFVEALGSDHRHVTHVGGAKVPFEDLAFRGKTHVEVALAPQKSAAGAASPLVSGLKRGLAGFDHLVFLAAVVVFARKPRVGIAAAGAFTLASLLGFAAVASGAFVPSASVVGPAVAATIVYVALDSLSASASRHPFGLVGIAVPFGLVHGFAYAEAFADLGQSRGAPFSDMAGFLLGIEVVSLSVAALAAVASTFARRGAWFGRWGERAIAGAACVAGAAWFIARILRPR